MTILQKLFQGSLYAFLLLFPILVLPFSLHPLSDTKQMVLAVTVFLALFFLLLFSMHEGKVAIPKSKALAFFCLFVCWMLVSALVSGAPVASVFGTTTENVFSLVNMFLFGLLLVLLVIAGITEKFISRAMWVFIASFLLLALYTALHIAVFLWQLPLPQVLIPLLPFATTNALAIYLGSGVTVMLGMLIFGGIKRIAKVCLGILCFILLLLVLLLSYKVILPVVAFVVVLFASFKIMRQGSLALQETVLLSMIFAILILGFIAPLPYFDQALDIANEVRPSFLATRTIGQNMIVDSWWKGLTGSGPALFAFTYQTYKDPTLNYTDFWRANFLQGFSFMSTMPISAGLIGFALFGGFLVGVGVEGFRALYALRKEKDEIFTSAVSVYGLWLYLTLFACIYPFDYGLLAMWFASAALVLAVRLRLDKKDAHTLTFSKYPEKAFTTSFALFAAMLFLVFGMYTLLGRYAASIQFARAAAVLESDTDLALSRIESGIKLFGLTGEGYRLLAQGYTREASQALQKMGQGQNDAYRMRFTQALNNTRAAGETATSKNTLDAQNYLLMGEFYESLIPYGEGNEDFAFAAYARASYLEPANPVVHYEAGRAYLALAQKLTALRAQLETQQQNMTTEQLRVLEDAYANAETEVRKALELKNDYLDAHVLLVQIYASGGKMQQAIEQTKGLVVAFPQDTDFAFQLGHLYYANNNYTDAENILKEIVRVFPDHANAHYVLGLIYEQQNKIADAIKEFSTVAEHNQDNADVAERLQKLRQRVQERQMQEEAEQAVQTEDSGTDAQE